MPRVPLTEFAAKKLVLGESYAGCSVTAGANLRTLKLPRASSYAVKVDTGTKRRGKNGLVKVGVKPSDVRSVIRKLLADGHARCLVEPNVTHDLADERYVSIELTRSGSTVLTSSRGGVDVEVSSPQVKQQLVPLADALAGGAGPAKVSGVPLDSLLSAMARCSLSFLEINPYVVNAGRFVALDMAAEVDTIALGKLPAWVREHVAGRRPQNSQEEQVAEMAKMSRSSFTLQTLNPRGSILTLLSGGGASLVAMDALAEAGLAGKVVNYSEYSGAPTRDEVAAYAGALLDLLLKSPARRRVLLVAGGVANFTDVRDTFYGIVDALEPRLAALRRRPLYVLVRRGGPNQEAGLAHLRDYLRRSKVAADVFGPELSLGRIGRMVAKHV